MTAEALPFEQVLTYQEFMEDAPSDPPDRLDVACPACGWRLKVVDDPEFHWVLVCACGWDEFS